MTIYEKTPGGLIATGERSISTYPSGLVRVDRTYICKHDAAATHRATLAPNAEMPGDDGSPAIDGLYIFPVPQEVRRPNGFTEFAVSAFGRTSTSAVITALKQQEFIRAATLSSSYQFSAWQIEGSIVVPIGTVLNYSSLGLEEELMKPFNFRLPAYPDYQNDAVTELRSVPARITTLIGNYILERLTGGNPGAVMSQDPELVPASRLYRASFLDADGEAVTRNVQAWIQDPLIRIVASRNFGVFVEIDFASERKLQSVDILTS
jgi:hypothetical protein